MAAILEQKKIRGLNTAWWVSGSTSPTAPIAMMFHGFPDSPDTWQGQLEVLEPHYRVVRPLARGAAESEPANHVNRYRQNSVLLDSLEILSEVDPTKSRNVVVFGHDLGAASAWELARALGPRAQAVVVVSGMSLSMFWKRRRRLAQHRRSWYIYLMQVPGLAERAFQWFGPQIVQRAYAHSGLIQGGPSDGGLTHQGLTNRGNWESLQAFVPGMIPHYRAGFRDAMASAVDSSRLHCPVLVLWGTSDPYLCSISKQEWESAARDTEIRMLDAGHWPHQERREIANRFILKFLEKFK
jgi:epoxide hydrolase 4